MNQSARFSVVGLLALVMTLGGCGVSGPEGANAPNAAESAQALHVVPGTLAMERSASVLTTRSETAQAVQSQGLRVMSLTKTAEVRVSRTVYDYTFKVTLANGTDTTFAAVSALLEGTGAGSNVVDGFAEAQGVEPQALVDAGDTVTIRHDRTKPFDSGALRWRVQGLARANPGPVSMQVSAAQIKPTVTFVDGLLTPVSSYSPLVLKDPQSGDWPVGKLIVRGGDVYRVLGSTINRQGETEVSVEARPFYDAFDQVAFKAQFGALLYDANGAPLLPATAASRSLALSAHRSAGRQGVLEDVVALRKKLGLLDCVLPNEVVESEPEMLGYHFRFNCSLADLLRDPTNEALKSVYLDGGYTYTAKTTYVFDKNARDDYVNEERKAIFGGTATVNVAQALKTYAGSSELCKADGENVTCEVELGRSDPFVFPMGVVGGVKISGDLQFFWKLSLTLTGNTTFSYSLTTKVVKVTGMQAGQERNDTSPPEIEHGPWNPNLSATTAGMFDASTSVGFDINLGNVFDAVTVARFTASLGYSVRAGALGQGNFMCFTTDKAVVVGVQATFLPIELIDFDGISTPEREWPFPIGEALSIPSGCVAPGEAGQLRLLYVLNGATQYATRDYTSSTVGRDVYKASGAWLQDKKSGTNPSPFFAIDMQASILEVGVPLDKLRVTASVPVKPQDSGAFASVEWDPISSADPRKRPIVKLFPGTTMPGETLQVAITMAVDGQPERTVNRKVELVFEPLLDAEPTYRYTVSSDGFVHYDVVFNYKGATQDQLAGLLIEMAHPDGPVTERVALAGANDPKTGGVIWYYPLNYLLAYRQKGSYQLVPTTLILESKATSGKSSSYRIPITLRDDVQVKNPITVEPNLAYVGDTLTFKITGASLPDALDFAFPACRDIKEVRSAELLEKNLFSTDYRVFTCLAVNSSFDNKATVLGGLGFTTPNVGYDMNVPVIRMSSAVAAVGEAIEFGLTQLGDWWGRAREVVWSFASLVQTQTTDLVTSVSQAFRAAGVYEVVARLRNVFNEGTIPIWFDVGTTRTTVTVTGAAPSVSSVDPLVATAGVASTFNVTGTGLPPGLRFLLPGCDAVEVLEGTGPALRKFTCTFDAAHPAGPVDGTVAFSDSPFDAPPLKAFTVVVSAGDVVPAIQPYSHFKFDNSLADAITPRPEISLVGAASPAWTTRGTSPAISLPSGQYLQHTNGLLVPAMAADGNHSFSVATWVKFNAWSTQTNAIVYERASGGADPCGGPTYGISNYFNFGGRKWLMLIGTHNEQGQCVNEEIWSTFDASLEQWYHVAGTYDQASGLARLYVNGAVVAEKTIAKRLSLPSNPHLSVGQQPWAFQSQALQGALDDLRFYRGALSQSDVQTLASDTSPQTSPLYEDFLGVAVDSTKWTTVDLAGNPTGTSVSVGNGLATFPSGVRLSTEGKLTISGRKIVVESRMAGLGGGRDTSINLVEPGSNARNVVRFGDTTYYNALYVEAYGVYSGSAPYILVTSGTSTNQWMEYRLTVDGDQVTVERGPTLAQIDTLQTRTFKLAQSIEGRSFFVNIGTGGPSYSPGTFDWVRVTVTP